VAIHSSQPRTPTPGALIEVPPTQQSVPSPTPARAAASTRRPTDAVSAGRIARDPSPPETRTYRTRTVWSLLALSLLPGVVARARPTLWLGLPDAWHWAIYVCSGVLLVAASILIVKPVDARRP